MREEVRRTWEKEDLTARDFGDLPQRLELGKCSLTSGQGGRGRQRITHIASAIKCSRYFAAHHKLRTQLNQTGGFFRSHGLWHFCQFLEVDSLSKGNQILSGDIVSLDSNEKTAGNYHVDVSVLVIVTVFHDCLFPTDFFKFTTV